MACTLVDKHLYSIGGLEDFIHVRLPMFSFLLLLKDGVGIWQLRGSYPLVHPLKKLLSFIDTQRMRWIPLKTLGQQSIGSLSVKVL